MYDDAYGQSVSEFHWGDRGLEIRTRNSVLLPFTAYSTLNCTDPILLIPAKKRCTCLRTKIKVREIYYRVQSCMSRFAVSRSRENDKSVTRKRYVQINFHRFIMITVRTFELFRYCFLYFSYNFLRRFLTTTHYVYATSCVCLCSRPITIGDGVMAEQGLAARFECWQLPAAHFCCRDSYRYASLLSYTCCTLGTAVR